jgi:hypothetical protein
LQPPYYARPSRSRYNRGAAGRRNAHEAVGIDKRGAAWFFFTFYPKVLTDHAGTVYLAPVGDSSGRPLEAGKTYKLTVPRDTPAKQFWSLTIYDRRTWSFVNNPLDRGGLGSFNKDQMKLNADGSVDCMSGRKRLRV